MPQSITTSTALQVINEEIDTRIALAKELGGSGLGSILFTLTNIKSALAVRFEALEAEGNRPPVQPNSIKKTDGVEGKNFID